LGYVYYEVLLGIASNYCIRESNLEERMNKIPERDWKTYKSMKRGVLLKACQEVIGKVQDIINEKEKSSYEKYGELLQIIKSEKKDMSMMFDGFSRSGVIQHLLIWNVRGLIDEEELSKYSEETVKKIKYMKEINF
jgi:hypothetical protein